MAANLTHRYRWPRNLGELLQDLRSLVTSVSAYRFFAMPDFAGAAEQHKAAMAANLK
jgi:hypothetical protein